MSRRPSSDIASREPANRSSPAVWAAAGALALSACGGDSTAPPAPPPPPPPSGPMLSVTHVTTESLDTTVVLPVTPPAGGEWSYDATESRWISG